MFAVFSMSFSFVLFVVNSFITAKVIDGTYCIGEGPVAGTCECGTEPLGSIKYGEFLV